VKRFPLAVRLFVLLAGATAALCTWLGSIRVGIAAGLVMTLIAVLVAWSLRRQG
jgi:spore maturation protein SpmA